MADSNNRRVLYIIAKYQTASKKERDSFEVPSCDSLGARTQDPILKRDVLYLLS